MCLQFIRVQVSDNGTIIFSFIQPTATWKPQELTQRWSIDLHPVQKPARRPT